MQVGNCACCGRGSGLDDETGLCPNCDGYVDGVLARYRARFCAADQAAIEDPESLWPDGCWRCLGTMHEGQYHEAVAALASERAGSPAEEWEAERMGNVPDLPAIRNVIKFMPLCVVFCDPCGNECYQAIHLCPAFAVDGITCTTICKTCAEGIAVMVPLFEGTEGAS